MDAKVFLIVIRMMAGGHNETQELAVFPDDKVCHQTGFLLATTTDTTPRTKPHPMRRWECITIELPHAGMVCARVFNKFYDHVSKPEEIAAAKKACVDLMGVAPPGYTR